MRNKIDTLMKKYGVNETVVVEDTTVVEQLLTALSQPNIDKVFFNNSKLNITFIDKDKECQNNNMI